MRGQRLMGTEGSGSSNLLQSSESEDENSAQP